MKFTDGFWRNREDFEVFNSAKVYDSETDAHSITVYAPHFDVQNRGQTLEGPLLTYRISSPMENVIKVQIWHFKDGQPRRPSFELYESDTLPVEVVNAKGHASLKSGRLEARISTGESWAVDFFDSGRPLTNSRWKNSGYVKGKNGRAYMKEELALGVGEYVYGLGERFTPFVKNGQTVDIWNADGGTSSELSYKNIPFYLTNSGYGVLVNDPGPVSFEVASEKVSRVQFSVEGEYLEYLVMAGDGPKGVLERYTALTGRPGLPPAWSFGLWLSTSFITQYDEKTVTGFIDGMEERKIPLSVFHFDCFWMKEYHWCDFEWDERFFPDPQGFLGRLKARGLRICVWINPYIAQRSALFDEGSRLGFLLKKPSGGVWQADTWQPGMGMVDFTNPGAREWYSDKLMRLVDMGVDCFKTDFGERIPTDVAYHDGSDPVRAHNYYTYLYNKTVYEALESKAGRGKSLVFARSATVGGQKFPVHWGGDCTASYESMAESLRGGLSLCMSGFGFWSHDISGFELTATPDLYKRWAAFGLLSSHSRLHGNSSYRVPWLFDDEAVEVLRFFARLKCSLMPYLWAQAVKASSTGVPMMRAMILEYPGDPACAYLDRQYFLGDCLLVAPVFSQDGIADYYLPDGYWHELLTSRRVQGGRWIREKHGYLSLPLYVPEGSMIASGPNGDRAEYDYAKGVSITLYGLEDGDRAETSVYSPEGGLELRVAAKREGGTLSVSYSGSGKPWKLILRSLAAIKADGASLAPGDGCFALEPSGSGDTFTVRLAAD